MIEPLDPVPSLDLDPNDVHGVQAMADTVDVEKATAVVKTEAVEKAETAEKIVDAKNAVAAENPEVIGTQVPISEPVSQPESVASNSVEASKTE